MAARMEALSDGVPAYAGMVLPRAVLRPGPRRCPRLRGDGPSIRMLFSVPRAVSPPTRGWSTRWCGDPGPRGGVPAYAGMVRAARAPSPAGSGCPRLRGDGPQVRVGSKRSRTVSPPTRGWSPDPCRRRRRRAGVPAYAGMVPAWPGRRQGRPRCPRLRGDGPGRDSRSLRGRGVSPPTRGWSRVCAWHAARRGGVPAYAGMVRRAGAGSPARRRCPRLRGDGPWPTAAHSAPASVSPPTRGWSAARAGGRPVWLGVPAYAGMVRRWRGSWAGPCWCPRLRGDGPVHSRRGARCAAVSPPTRGWSCQFGKRATWKGGVPAYAGMVLRPCVEASSRSRCPRLRGDGPA